MYGISCIGVSTSHRFGKQYSFLFAVPKFLVFFGIFYFLSHICVDFGFIGKIVSLAPGDLNIWRAGSEVFLAGPAVAAASAVTGTISSPEEL